MAADGSLLFDTKLDGKGLASGAAKLGKIAAVGLAAVSGAIIKVGSDFESTMAKVSTIADTSVMSMTQLGDGIKQISSATGESATSLSEALYQALSAGVATGDALGFVEQSSKLATAGFTTTTQAVDALSTVMNGYKMEAAEVTKVSDIMLMTQNRGKTTVDELSASLAHVIPIASAMDVSFESVSAALATMTAQGTPTAQATTQLNSLFAELSKKGTKASEALQSAAEGTKYAGMSFHEMMDAGVPLNEVLNMMRQYAGESGLEMQDLFGSIEAGNAALQLTGDNAERFAEDLKAMDEAAGATEEGFAKMSDTLQFKMKTLGQSIVNIGISIYEDMQEPLKNMADEAIASLDKLVNAYETDGVSGLIQAGSDMIVGLAAGMAEALPGVIQAGMDAVTSFVESLNQQAPRIANAAIQMINTLVNGLVQSLPTLTPAALSAVATFVGAIIAQLPQIINSGIKLIGALAEGIVNSLPKILNAAGQSIATFVRGILSRLPEIVSTAIQVISNFASGLIKSLPEITSSVVTLAGEIINGFLHIDWVSVGVNIIQGIISGIGSMGSALLEAAVGVAKSAFNGIKSFFGIKSPSRLMKEKIGKFIPMGIAVGAEEEAPKSVKQIKRNWKENLEKIKPFDVSYQHNDAYVPAVAHGAIYEGNTTKETNNEYNYNITQSFTGEAAKKPSDVRKQTKKAIRQIEWEKA